MQYSTHSPARKIGFFSLMLLSTYALPEQSLASKRLLEGPRTEQANPKKPRIQHNEDYISREKVDDLVSQAIKGDLEAREQLMGMHLHGLYTHVITPSHIDFLNWTFKEGHKTISLAQLSYKHPLYAAYIVAHMDNEHIRNFFPHLFKSVFAMADDGDPLSLMTLGHMYAQGKGVGRDLDLAHGCYKKAASLGCAQGHYHLGLMSLRGQTKDWDAASYVENAIEHFRASLDMEANGDVLYHLATVFYDHSLNKQEALHLFKYAGKMGHAEAFYELGMHSLCQDKAENSPEKAEKYFSYAHALGHRGASQMLENLPKIVAQREDIIGLRDAAENEGFDAMYNLAQRYETGNGVPVNTREAISLYNTLAENRYPDALVSLSHMHRLGQGVEINDHLAYHLCEKAANKGNPRGLTSLAYLYLMGIGTKTNYRMASQILEKSIAIEETSAAFASLGYMYAKGLFFKRDRVKAVELFEKAANMGSPVAHYNLGRAYRSGKEGIGIDLEKAKKHFEYAAKSGHNKAQEALLLLNQSLTAQSISLPQKEEIEHHQVGSVLQDEDVARALQDDEDLIYLQKLQAEEYNATPLLSQIKDEIKRYLDSVKHRDTNTSAFSDLTDPMDHINSDVFDLMTAWFPNQKEEQKPVDVDALGIVRNEAEQGDMHSQYIMGCIYAHGFTYDGKTIVKDTEKAECYLTSALFSGLEKARPILNNILERNAQLSLQTARPATTSQASPLQQDLSPSTANAPLPPMKQIEQALSAEDETQESEEICALKRAAQKGDARAQCELALMYYEGNQTDASKEKAFYWFQKAADQGNAQAQCELAVMYYHGESVPADKKMAAHLFELSSKQDYEDAKRFLGLMLYRGDGIPQNKEEAARLFEPFVQAGDMDICHYYAAMCATGEGVPQDVKRALELYETLRLIDPAQETKEYVYNLGYLNYKDKTSPGNYNRAQNFFLRSIEMGFDTSSYHYLGMMYLKGKGVEQDLKEAESLLRFSAHKGSSDSDYKLGHLHLRYKHDPIGAMFFYIKAVNGTMHVPTHKKGAKDGLSRLLTFVKEVPKTQSLASPMDTETQNVIPDSIIGTLVPENANVLHTRIAALKASLEADKASFLFLTCLKPTDTLRIGHGDTIDADILHETKIGGRSYFCIGEQAQHYGHEFLSLEKEVGSLGTAQDAAAHQRTLELWHDVVEHVTQKAPQRNGAFQAENPKLFE